MDGKCIYMGWKTKSLLAKLVLKGFNKEIDKQKYGYIRFLVLINV